MKRFSFPLHPVSVLRAHRELLAQEAFAASVNAFVKSQETLAATRARVARFEASLFAGRRVTFNPAAEAQALAAYRQECAVEIETERAMFAAKEAMAKCRAAYLEAHRSVEVLNRLEANARLEHRLETSREEQAEFDDVATRRAMRPQTLFKS